MVQLDERLTLEDLDITDTRRYVERGYPWQEWDLLRREAPVYWYERPGFEPFWALTKLADMESIESGLRRREERALQYGGSATDTPDLVFMDPPEHRQYRGITGRKFTPRAMAQIEGHFDELARTYVGDFARVLADRFPEGDAVDFVHELACKLPVAAICEMAGVPFADWDQVFYWTETRGAAADPE